MSVVLHVWPGQWNLISIDPSCIAAIIYLQLTIPGKFLIAECVNPDASPSGNLPYLTHEYHVLSSLPSIFSHIASLRRSFGSGKDLERELSLLERSQTVAWSSHIQSSFGDLIAYMFYSVAANWAQLTHPALVSMLSVPQRYYVPGRIREIYEPRLKTAGLWHSSNPEEPEQRPFFGEKKKEVGKEKEIMQSAFAREKILEKARSVFDLYSRLLGEGEFFYHETLTTLDIQLAAHTLMLLDVPFPCPILQTLLVKSYPQLVSHAKRVRLVAFPPDTPLPQNTPTTRSSIRSHLPWPGVQHNKLRPKPPTEEEIRFTRMRWAWVSLAVGSSLVYVLSSVKHLRFVAADVDDDGGDEDVEDDLEDE